MKILFVIPHYYNTAGGQHGSTSTTASRRVRALAQAIFSLHQHFGQGTCEIDIYQRKAIPICSGHELKIILVTTGDAHLINDLPLPQAIYEHYNTDAEPLMLGFECQALLEAYLKDDFDYYCFMEDDLVIHDALFFEKLNQFNEATSILDLLQPNRYEVSSQGPFVKAYVDGDIRPGATSLFQNVQEHPFIERPLLGMSVPFRRPLNPHSGCFFLSQAQMRYWTEQPHFLDRDVRFISPLESAATLGIMKTFRVYKPDRAFAHFLEVQHADSRFIQMIGRQIPFQEPNAILEP